MHFNLYKPLAVEKTVIKYKGRHGNVHAARQINNIYKILIFMEEKNMKRTSKKLTYDVVMQLMKSPENCSHEFFLFFLSFLPKCTFSRST